MRRRWYIPLALLFITAFVPWWQEVGRVNKHEEIERMKIAPTYSLEQIRIEYQWIREREDDWRMQSSGQHALPEKAGMYWVYLERRTMLEDAMRAYTQRNDKFQPEVDSRFKSLITMPKTGMIHAAFSMKFGDKTLFNTKPKTSYLEVKNRIPPIPSNSWPLFVQGYGWSIPIMFLVFCIRLRERELIVWVEMWRLVPAAVFWPIAIFIYPMSVERREQLKWAVNVASYAMSASLSIFGAGAVAPLKAQVGAGSGKGSIGKKSDEKRFSSAIGVELYPVTTGVDRGVISAPWFAYKLDAGKGFTLSGFHFVEAGERKAQLFTNHGTTLSHKSWRGAMFNVEVGGTSAGMFAQVGPRFNLVRLPWLGAGIAKVAKSVVAGRGLRVRGPTHFQENFLSWASHELPLGKGVTVATEGFMRFRVGGLPAVGQPQVLFRHKKLRFVDFVTEFWMIRSDPTVRMGIQLHR